MATNSDLPRDSSLSSGLSQAEINAALQEFSQAMSNVPEQWRRQYPFYRKAFKGNHILKVDEPNPKRYYILPIIGSYTVKISFDRLALLAVLDRNKNVLQTIISVILATLVALFGYILLTRNYFYDFWVFVICFVIAKCQFSLLKSVQPDSASPIHGHNNTIVFSRAIYFCITALLIIGLDEATKLNAASIELYGVTIYSQETLTFARDVLIGFILAFPIIFVIGLLPQISTFMMHVLEQLDMHVFGGSAMTSLTASFYSITRSVVCVCVLTPVCYIPLQYSDKSRGMHVVFSIFAGLLLTISYHISR